MKQRYQSRFWIGGGLLLLASANAAADPHVVTSGSSTYTYDLIPTNATTSYLNLGGTTASNYYITRDAINAGQINDAGKIVGNLNFNDSSWGGFVGSSQVAYTGQVSSPITPGYAVTGINNGGTVVGWYDNLSTASNPANPASWAYTAYYSQSGANDASGAVTTIPVSWANLGVTSSLTSTYQYIGKNEADGISDGGIVAGTTTFVNGTLTAAYNEIWTYNTSTHAFTVLPTANLSALASDSLYAVNNASPINDNPIEITGISSNGNFIVGYYEQVVGGITHDTGFVFNETTDKYSVIGTAPTGSVNGEVAEGVNNNGIVVGRWNSGTDDSVSAPIQHGFIWNANTGTYVNANVLDPHAVTGGGGGTDLLSINNNNVIFGVSNSLAGIGAGDYVQNPPTTTLSYFTLTGAVSASAVPLPGAAWLMAGALGLLGVTGRRRAV